MDGAQNLVLVQSRTDGLSDLRQKRELLSAALRVMHHHVIFQSEPNLQGQSDQQPQVRRAKHPSRRVRKQNHPKIVLTGLQAHRGHVVDTFRGQYLAELREAAAGKDG